MGRQPSVSLQSKIRSTSFRDNGPLSPAALSGNPLLRIEELERENRKLSKEAEEHENRWRKVEEELEEVREQNAEKSPMKNDAEGEIQRLRAEIETLRRRTSSTTAAAASRRESAVEDTNGDSLKADLTRKDSTIADMQLEISRLRSQLSSQTEGCSTHGEQIAALQQSLSSTQNKLHSTQTELSDVRKSLSKASEKAVLDGTERTSKDTQIRTLERELGEATATRDQVSKKAEQLSQKIDAMNKLHREAENRHATKLAAAEAAVREVPALRARVEKAEMESSRLREKHKRVMSGGDLGADEGLEELEDEERHQLERRIRQLEGEVFDLRRGVWRDKRAAMQPRNLDGDDVAGEGGDQSRTSLDPQGEDFDEVDLTGHSSSRRRSCANHLSQPPQRHSNFAQVLNSGLAAFRTNTTSPPAQTRPRNDSLLEEFDDGEDGFDENAFAQAQREEEMKKMVEHVREVKRGLRGWSGWRLDLVEARRVGASGGGSGFGEIFEV